MSKEKTSNSTNSVVSDLLWRDLIRTEKLNQRESKWGWLVDDYVKLAASTKDKSRRWQTKSYQTECFSDNKIKEQPRDDKVVTSSAGGQEIHQSGPAIPSPPQTEARVIGWLSAAQHRVDKYGGTASSRPKNSILRQLDWPWEACN